MPIVKRQDGVNFVLQPYRETLTIKNASILRKEVRYLADQYGENVRLFKRKGADYEAVFSREPGALLGETVWHYFNEPDDLIYCEYQNHSSDPQVLLVIVREGKVYLDARMSLEPFFDEMTSLLVETSGRYAVYAYGDFGQVFEHPAIKFFTRLEKSLFAELEVKPAFQLWHVESALDEHGLSVQRRSSLIVVTVVCLAVLGILWWYARSSEKITLPQVNPYELYESILETPNPEQQIQAFVKGVQKIDSIEGWVADDFDYKGDAIKTVLHSLGGTTVDLVDTAQALGMTVSLSSEGAVVSLPISVENRPKPAQIAPSQQVLTLVIDRMMQVLPGKSVQINNVTSNKVFNQTAVKVSFNDASPEILTLIADRFKDLPVALQSITVNRQEGLFSGTLELNVVGN